MCEEKSTEKEIEMERLTRKKEQIQNQIQSIAGK